MRKLKYLDNAYTEKEKPLTEYPEKLIKHFLKLINFKSGVSTSNKNNKVLDVGCGRGDQLNIFKKLKFDTYGLDLELKNEVANSHNFNQCDFSKDKFPYNDNYFDIIISKSIIEHLYLDGIENFLIEIKRVLKPGGYLIILTPSWEYNFKQFYDEFTHVTPFSKRSLEKCVLGYSFKILSINYFIQLPFIWKFPQLKFFCDFINLIKPPRKWGKVFKWSQDRALLCIAQK